MLAKPTYAVKKDITITLNGLSGTTPRVSDPVSNATDLYEWVWLTITIAGTGAANANLDVRILASTDGGVSYATWENAIRLIPVDFPSTPQTLVYVFRVPEYWKLAVVNNTGSALSGSGNAASYQGYNMGA